MQIRDYKRLSPASQSAYHIVTQRHHQSISILSSLPLIFDHCKIDLHCERQVLLYVYQLFILLYMYHIWSLTYCMMRLLLYANELCILLSMCNYCLLLYANELCILLSMCNYVSYCTPMSCVSYCPCVNYVSYCTPMSCVSYCPCVIMSLTVRQ